MSREEFEMGIMIALSGLDGSGKSSQAERLSVVCKEKGLNVDIIQLKIVKSEKYLLEARKKMRQYRTKHQMDNNDELYNIGSALLFKEKVYDVVEKSINSYDVTILDRYRESGQCYHYINDGLFPSVRHIYDSLPKPDINIFFDLSPDVCYKRVILREIQSPFETLEYLQKAYEFYQSVRDRFLWVNATQSMDNITQLLLSEVELQLNKKALM